MQTPHILQLSVTTREPRREHKQPPAAMLHEPSQNPHPHETVCMFKSFCWGALDTKRWRHFHLSGSDLEQQRLPIFHLWRSCGCSQQKAVQQLSSCLHQCSFNLFDVGPFVGLRPASLHCSGLKKEWQHIPEHVKHARLKEP